MPNFIKSLLSTSPSNILKNIENKLNEEKSDSPNDQNVLTAEEDIKLSTSIQQMQLMLYGTGANHNEPKEANPNHVKILTQGLLQNDLLIRLLYNLHLLDFDAKSSLVHIYQYMLHNNEIKTIELILKNNQQFFTVLINSYQCIDLENGILINCNKILNSCLDYAQLTTTLLKSYSQYIQPLFTYIKSSNFDISGPSFATFRKLFLQKYIASELIKYQCLEFFFKDINLLLLHDNLITRTQIFEFLNSFLTIRTKEHYEIMLLYINNPANLMICMSNLRTKSTHTQIAVFNLLKIFIYNPSKSTPIKKILYMNKDKLLLFTTSFEGINSNDSNEAFIRDKNDVINSLNQLQYDP